MTAIDDYQVGRVGLGFVGELLDRRRGLRHEAREARLLCCQAGGMSKAARCPMWPAATWVACSSEVDGVAVERRAS